MPLPWEQVQPGQRRTGLSAGRHTAGFISTVRDLASRAPRPDKQASAVHSTIPILREREYADCTADLVRRTEAIAMMTTAVTDDKPASKASTEVRLRSPTQKIFRACLRLPVCSCLDLRSETP